MTPAQEARLAMRRKEWTGPTKHKVPGYVKCNLVVLPREDSYDFLVYCVRNPKPCPVIEITDPGVDLSYPYPNYCHLLLPPLNVIRWSIYYEA